MDLIRPDRYPIQSQSDDEFDSDAAEEVYETAARQFPISELQKLSSYFYHLPVFAILRFMCQVDCSVRV